MRFRPISGFRFRIHNQEMTPAARAMAIRKSLGHRSWRVATGLQSVSLPNMISMRLRRLYRRVSLHRCFAFLSARDTGAYPFVLQRFSEPGSVIATIITVFSLPCSPPTRPASERRSLFRSPSVERLMRTIGGVCAGLEPMAARRSPFIQRKPLRLLKMAPRNPRPSSARVLP